MRRYNAITGKFEDDEEQNVNTTSGRNNSIAQYNAIENTFVKPTVSLEQPKEEKNISTFAKDVFSKNREIANGILSQKSDNNLDSQANNEIKLKSSKEYYKQFLQEYEKDTGHDFESDMSSKDYDAGITIRGNLTRLSNKEKIERAEKYAQESKTYKQYLEAVDREKAEKQQKLEEKVASHETNAWDATGRQFTSQVLPAVKDLLLGFGATADPLNKEKYEQKAKDTLPTESQLIADKAYQENKNPILKVGQDLLRTTGNMVPSLAVSAINPTAGLMTTGFSSGGSGFRQAIQEGKNYDEAYVYGALEGAKEATFQKLLGGISAFGNSTAKKVLGNNIDQAFAKLIKNPTARMYIGDMISEGSEEYLQEILEPVVRNLAFGENNEFKLVTPEALYSGFLGTLNSGILNAPSAIKNNRNLSQYSDENSIAKNPQNNENVSNMENSSIQNANISQELKQEIQNKTREQNQNNSNVEFVPIQDILPYKSNGGYRTEDQINDLETNIRQNGITNPIELIKENDGTIRIENGNHRLEVAQRLGLEEVPIVFVDSIENIDNTSYNNVKTLVKGEYNGNGNHENTRTFSENNASEQFINGNSRNNSEQFNDRRTATRNDRLYQQMVGYNNRPSSNTTRQQNSVQSQEKRLNDSISNQVNTFNLGRDNNVNSNTTNNSFIDSAKKYNIKTDNDTIRTIDRVMSERKINAIFDDTQFKNNNVNALWRINEDGSRAVVFNPNANTQDLMENVAVHELYHDIANQQGNNYLQDLVLNMASTKEGYLKARKALSNEYAKVYDASDPNFNNIVNEEAVASILGEKLGNQEFINQLTTEKRSVARVIYDAIVNLLNKLNKLTGYKSEKLYWADVKNKFEKAYKNTGVNRTTGKVDTETRYSQKTLQDGSYVAYAKRNLIPNNNLLKSIKKEAPTSKSRGVLPSTSNISDFNQNVKSDTRYSMQQLGKNTQKDNQGHLLSKQQQEYFKNSKAKDKNGNLKVLYHGTPNNFTRFNYDFIGNNGTAIGKGFYLTDSKDVASGYTGETGNVMEVYTNITNPMSLDKKNITKADLKKFIQQLSSKDEYYLWDYGDLSSESYNSVLDKAVDSNYEYSDNDVDLIHGVLNTSTLSWEESFRLLKNILGYDGIIKDYGEHIVYVPTLPEQIKLITNETPTKNDDIRYSKENVTWDDFVKENFKNEGTGRRLQDLKENVTMQNNKNNSKTELNENKQDDVLTIKQENNIANQSTNDNIKGDGNSKFYKNITERSKFLTQENRDKLSTEDYIKYYDKVSNKESMEGALQRLNKGGQAELTRWFAKGSDDKAFSNLRATWDSTDVAEGWILLKRAQDNQDYDMMVEVAKKMREIGTKSGQAVQMYNVLSRLTPEGMVKYATSELDEAWQIASKNKSKKWWDKHIDDFQLKPEETQFIIDQMNKVEKMEDGYKKNVEIAKVQKMLQDKLPPQKGQGLKSWMRVSMLLNPKTQVRNVVGNALIAPVNAVADRFSAMADRMISRKTGVRTTGKTNWKNYGKGFGRGLYQSYNDFKQGINTRNVQGNRFEIGQGKSFNENHKGFLSKPRNAISKSLNRVDRFLSFVLDAGDRGFYEASFTNSINNQLALNNTTEVTQDMIDIATNEALSRTWQDNNNYTKFVLDVRRGMNKINIKGYGLGDILIPFAKTPANLTKAIVDYSPIGLTKTLIADGIKLKNNISNGTVTAQQQHRFVQNLGKATAGTMLYILGFALAQAGITSGANDDDKDVSDFMRNTLGIQPYSIKIGNHSFTYDWAQPIAAPFAITADITRALKDDEVSLQDAITTSLDSGFNILLEQSFLSSIQDVLNSSYGSTTENIIDQILGLPARGVSTFIKQINDMIDSKTRMVYERDQPFESAKNQIKTKIPGLSQDLPVKRDTLGREIEKYGGENNFFNVFINPANISKGKVSESAKEIYDVYQATKDKTIMPRSAPNDLSMTITKKDGTKKKKELVLDNKDKSEFLKISGGIVDKNVKKLKDNKYYKKLNDDEKALVIKEIVDYSYNKAKADLLDIDMSEVSGYKTVTKKLKGGMALYDYYAQEIYKNR